MKAHSLYHNLVFRIIVFLVVPFLFCVGFFAVRMAEDSEKSYQTNIRLYVEQGRSVREMHVNEIYAIANKICTNNSLNGFFLVPYRRDNLKYYCSQIAAIISAESAERRGYKIRVFYTNETIPRGLGAFYHLNDLDEGRAAQFIQSDAQELWVLPCDTEGYTGAFTPYAGHYTYFRKVFVSDQLLYVLTISVPESQMDSFLTESVRRETSLDTTLRVMALNSAMVLNYGVSQDFSQSTDDSVEADLQTARERGAIIERVQDGGLPQDLVYVFPPNPQMGKVVIIICILLIFTVSLVYVALRFARQIFISIYACLEAFEDSVANGFKKQLPVRGDDEIARLTRSFNAQISKIQNLLQITAVQAVAVKESQLKALQQQINPHFLYNTMEILSYKMEKNNHFAEADALIAFSNMLRYNTKSEDPFSSLEMELKQVDNYLQIQSLKNTNVTFFADIPLDLYKLKMPRFLLQPIVENCFSHGYYGKPMNIVLKATDDGAYIDFRISDNGKGLTPKELMCIEAELDSRADNSRLGIGLSNINARLCLFFSEACGIRLSSEKNQGTTVGWKIPKVFYNSET